MSKEVLTRCGYRCDLCLAYKDNIEKDDQRLYLSDTWFKIYGFRIPANEIFCEGCLASNNSDIVLIDKECPVRPCVIEKGIENCSQCEAYPCDKLNQRTVIYEDLLKKIKINISPKDYKNCIKPYENKKRLDTIKAQIGEYSRMLNPEIVPAKENIIKFLEHRETVNSWLLLIEFMNTSYNLDCKTIFGGKKYGWAIQYKKGKKTIVTFFPERKAFTVLLTFGSDELKRISEIRNILSKRILSLISETKQLHDGKWMWIRIIDKDLVDDLINLIKIKRKPDNV